MMVVAIVIVVVMVHGWMLDLQKIFVCYGRANLDKFCQIRKLKLEKHTCDSKLIIIDYLLISYFFSFKIMSQIDVYWDNSCIRNRYCSKNQRSAYNTDG
jgi:hypothetical protein